MSESQHKSKSKTKLLSALDNAALESINEDIIEIHETLERILNNLPKIVDDKVNEIEEGIHSLEKALEVVPRNFDESFTKKINLTLDVAKEIELYSKQLRIELVNDVPKTITKEVVGELKKTIDEKLNTKHESVAVRVLIGTIAGIIGGAITATSVITYLLYG